MFFETRKTFKKIRIKILKCLSYRNVANDVLFQRPFTDVGCLNWFSRYK